MSDALPKSARAYSQMTSKTLGSDWSKKVQMYIDATADLTGQHDKKKGFKNSAGTGKVPHAMKENIAWDDNLSWESNIFAQYHGRQPNNAGELSFWLNEMGQQFEAETDRRWWWDRTKFDHWLEHKIIISRAMGESTGHDPYDVDWKSLFAGYHGRAPVDEKELEKWLDDEWEAYAAERNPRLGKAIMSKMTDDQIAAEFGSDVPGLSADFQMWLLDRVNFKNLGESIVDKLLGESSFYDSYGFRGWVSPNGEKFHLHGDEPHGREQTEELLRQFYPNWDWQSNPNFTQNETIFSGYALQFRGWIRVIGDGMYSTWQLTNGTSRLLRELVEEVAQNNPDQIFKIDFYLGRSIEGTAEEVLEQLW